MSHPRPAARALLLFLCLLVSPLPALAASAQEVTNLPARMIRRLGRAVAQAEALGARRDAGKKVTEGEIRQIEAEFIKILNRAPVDPAVGKELGRFYSRWGMELQSPSPDLLALLGRVAEPDVVALHLASEAEMDNPLLAAAALTALSRRADRAILWERLARLTWDPVWQAVFLEQAFKRLPWPQEEDELAAAVSIASRWLLALGEAGLLDRVRITFVSLPPAVQGRIQTDKDLALAEDSRDLRLDLAAAFLVTGDPGRTVPLFRIAALAAGERGTAEPSAFFFCEQDLSFRSLLQRWLEPGPEDAFPALTDALRLSDHWRIGRKIAFARLAQREGYPAAAAYLLRQVAYQVQLMGTHFGAADQAPEAVQASARRLTAEVAELRRTFDAEARTAAEAARAALGPDPAAVTVARRLAAPPAASVFVERRLPSGVGPLELSAAELERRRREDIHGLQLPESFYAVRVERRGQEVVALGVSQRYDPMGEVAPGGYWVLFSADGGSTWSPPLYTGLRAYQPYVVRPASAVPLLARDRLKVEVEIKELDTSIITFPPIGLAAKRREKGLLLEISLAALRQDGDGDGLTDLAEERLLLDPTLPDTDGDGLKDGEDPLPGVPYTPSATPAARALAAFVATVGRPDGPPDVERTAFFVGDRALFAPLQSGGRVVVLTPEEAAAVKERLGPFFPFVVEAFFLDRAGKRAFVVWSASWMGGRVLVEERDETWAAEETAFWIT